MKSPEPPPGSVPLRRLGAAAAVCLTLAVLLAAFFGSRKSSHRMSAARATEAAAPVTTHVHAADDHKSDPGHVGSRGEPTPERAALNSTDPLEDYLLSAAYPPTSRPLTEHSRDLIEWNRRHDTPRGAPGTAGAKSLLTADRFWVSGNEAITLSLSAERGAIPVAVRIVRSEASADASSVSLQWQVGPDGSLTSQLLPARAFPQFEAGQLRVHVEFALDSGPEQQAFLNFAYTSPAALPAAFTGALSDNLEDGSLQLQAGVNVRTPGHYLIDCNLYAQDGTPVAWARFKGQLDAGETRVPLVFFGRALAASGQAGPYRIGQLRGARYAPGKAQDLERMAAFEGEYATAAYALDEFSEQQWDAPEKQRKIAALSRVVRP